jgi:hypothetical protein
MCPECLTGVWRWRKRMRGEVRQELWTGATLPSLTDRPSPHHPELSLPLAGPVSPPEPSPQSSQDEEDMLEV